jgi:hypothetical protein
MFLQADKDSKRRICWWWTFDRQILKVAFMFSGASHV